MAPRLSWFEPKRVVRKTTDRGIRERTLSAIEIRELRHIFASMATTYQAAKNKRITLR